MALILTLHLTPFFRGGVKIEFGTIAMDSSYPTGGEDITFEGFNKKPMVVIFETKGGYLFEYDRTNGKVKAYYPRGAVTDTLAAVVDAGATSVTSTAANGSIITLSGNAGVAASVAVEVSNTTDLSAITSLGYVAIGY